MRQRRHKASERVAMEVDVVVSDKYAESNQPAKRCLIDIID